MSESDRKLVAACDQAVDRLADEFVKKPLLCFSEKDLHWRFCSYFIEELRRQGINEVVENRAREHVSVIHQEYGSREGKGHRIDVVILRPEDLANSVGVSMATPGIRYLAPLVALEFGTEKSDNSSENQSRGDLVTHTKNDLRKLQGANAQVMRLVVFYRFEESDEGRKRIERLSECLAEIENTHPRTVVFRSARIPRVRLPRE